jgi:hypothetical protein
MTDMGGPTLRGVGAHAPLKFVDLVEVFTLFTIITKAYL